MSKLFRTTVVAAALLAAGLATVQSTASPLSWLGGERIQGSGSVVKQVREVGTFNGIGLSTGGKVEVRLGSTDSVTVQADDNVLPLIETVVENGLLKIRPLHKNQQLDTRNLKVFVQARDVQRIAVGGSGSVDAEGLHGPKLQMDVGGSGSISLRDVDADGVTVALGGSGNLKASGKAERLTVSIGGSGTVDVAKLATRTASVSIGGSGQATVWAKQSLSASVAGSGDVAYYGDPQLNRTVMGSGTVKRLGGAP